MKTNKTMSQRVRVTKNGKVMRRKAGQGHFNAKKRRKDMLTLKTPKTINIKKKTLDRFLPHK